MPEQRKTPRGSGTERAELDRRWAEIQRLEPYLALAREIQLDVARVAADDSADAASLTEAIERIPREEREAVARSVFERLSPETQWSVLSRVFGDDELAACLQTERDRLVEQHRHDGPRRVAEAARAEGRLDAAAVPAGETVTLGLFREADARAALPRGRRSTTCARELVLRGETGGGFRVIDDVFNPRGGYFVTLDYDEASWRDDRLPAHDIIGVGAITDTGGRATFDPALYPGGRVDFRRDEDLVPGRLHLGFVLLGDIDVFAT